MTPPLVRQTLSRRTARWSASRTPSPLIAEYLGVTPARARHIRPDLTWPVVLDLISDPKADGVAFAAAALEAMERRYIEEADAGPEALRARLSHLLDRLLKDRLREVVGALVTRRGLVAACMDAANDLIEVAAIVRVLGMDEEG